MTFNMNRRALIAGGAATLSASALGVPRLAFGQESRLRLMWWGSQPRAERTMKVSELYTKKNPGVTIDGETVGWDDYWPRLATQVAGRNAPDVIQMDYRYIFEYARRDTLVPLESYVPAVLNVSDFDKAALDGGSVDGSLYGISLGANSSAMMINSAAFEEAGIAIPDNSLTFDELKRIGEEITKAGKRQNFHGLSDGSGVEPFFENFVRQRGKALYTAEGKLAFNAEDAREWFELWTAMRESKACVTPDLQALDKNQIETSMVSLGHAAVSYAHSNQLVGYQTINKEPIIMHPYPRIAAGVGGGHYRKPSMFFSVSKQSQNPEAAAAYISFFVTDQEAATILDVERGVPESAAVREYIKPKLDETGAAAVDYISGLGDLAGALPPPPPLGAGEIDKMLLRISQEVAFGQHTPQSGAEAFVAEAESILARG